MGIQESGEMYLETIRILSSGGKHVRAIDIGEYMGYSKPSVSRAMKILKDKRLIEINALGHITLTDEGAAIANTMYERHKLLTSLLVSLGVDEDTAAADACKIEHCISEKSFDAIKKHVKDQK
ncbi:MAG: metal-dependent transcriptional regulator [Clostridia bacterium]|nr:metal-dependent transcriptional regulator [Clostridia bacterium]